MTGFWFVLREVWKGFRRSPVTSFGLLVSVSLVLMLLQLFWVVAIGLEVRYRELLGSVEIELFVSDSLHDSTVVTIEDSLKAIPLVASTRYVSREQARTELSRLAGRDLLADYDSLNPLPRSFVVTLEPDCYENGQFPSLIERLAAVNRSGDVVYSRQWLADAEETRRELVRVGTVLGLICLCAAALNLINGIRLLARTRAVGTAQLLLQGAGRLFVAMPYILEGIAITLLATGVSWGMVWYVVEHVRVPRVTLLLPPLTELAAFCLIAVLLGGISGFVGVRRSLSYSR